MSFNSMSKVWAPDRPAFIIIGACKSGTTTMYDDLALHPEICLPEDKEPNILGESRDLERLQSRYRKHFKAALPGQHCGEASTYYTMIPEFGDVSERAYRLMGKQARLIYLMRDPIDRIQSHLVHDYSVGRIDGTDLDTAALTFSRYINWSDYPSQLRPWIDRFGRAAVLCIKFEDFIQHRLHFNQVACEHIGVDPLHAVVGESASNVRGTQRTNRINGSAGLMAALQRSTLIRQAVPTALRKVGKSLLQRRRPPLSEKLSAEARAELAQRFSDIHERLERLGVHGFDWRDRWVEKAL